MAPPLNTARLKGPRATCPRIVVARRQVVDGRHCSRKDMRCCHDQTRDAHVVDFQTDAAVSLLLRAFKKC